jgi:hypothetical protein
MNNLDRMLWNSSRVKMTELLPATDKIEVI